MQDYAYLSEIQTHIFPHDSTTTLELDLLRNIPAGETMTPRCRSFGRLPAHSGSQTKITFVRKQNINSGPCCFKIKVQIYVIAAT